MSQVKYYRVSSVDQNIDRQIEGMAHIKGEESFTDHCSGGDRDRPAFKECLRYLRKGDMLNVYSIDRLARDMRDLLNIVHELQEQQIGITFHKENLVFTSTGGHDPFQKMMLQMLGAAAEFEKSMINERQREGIAAAKAKGKQMGRPAVDPAVLEKARALKAEGMAMAKIAKEVGLGRSTLYRLLKDD